METSYLHFSRAFVPFPEKPQIQYVTDCDVRAQVHKIDPEIAFEKDSINYGMHVKRKNVHYIFSCSGISDEERDYVGAHEEGHLLQSFKLGLCSLDKRIAEEFTNYPQDLHFEMEAHIWALLRTTPQEKFLGTKGMAQAVEILNKPYGQKLVETVQSFHPVYLRIPKIKSTTDVTQ